ncbi:MAG TPA: substrate-binding domain-containing protein [Methanomicrobiales archaeon]|jgi:tungstate transport system substrate-binding protein|nr:substrate-binding domain-containing protein [Methanomicrobiales archaeon]
MKFTEKLCLIGLCTVILLAGILIAGCTQPQAEVTPTPATTAATTTAAATPTPVVHSPDTLLIATTTSLYDTGLLNAVQDLYENRTGIKLKITSQGTGIAIQVATRGDCDLLLVHSPSQEKAFIDKGLGINQRCFAYNYYMIVGPQSNPAGITNDTTPEAAFAKIRMLGLNNTPGVFFASRGDNSGTHNTEQTIWKNAGLNYTKDVATSGPWYLSLGKGMGETLTVASQKGAYTITDEGTFLAFKSQLNLVPLITYKLSLLNRYSAIAVNNSVNTNVNIVQADRFINWLISDDGKQFVGNYGLAKYGKSLFTPLTPDVCTKAPFNCTCTGDVSPA